MRPYIVAQFTTEELARAALWHMLSDRLDGFQLFRVAGSSTTIRSFDPYVCQHEKIKQYVTVSCQAMGLEHGKDYRITDELEEDTGTFDWLTAGVPKECYSRGPGDIC